MSPTATPKQPPGPPRDLIGGHVLQYRRDPISFLTGVRREYGDVAQYHLLKWPFWQLSHPADVREVLLTQANKVIKSPIYKMVLSKYLGNGLLISDGSFWKRQRRLAQPAFHLRRIETYADLMTEYTDEMIAEWDQREQVDIYEEMTSLTLYLVVKIMFNTDIRGSSGAIAQGTHVLHQSVMDEQNQILRAPDWIPTPANRRKRQSIDSLNEIALKIIAERRESGEDKGDLLSMLLMAQDEDGASMSDEEVKNEALTIFLAGHDTTANALTWAWYLLSKHPEVEAKLHEEVDRVLGTRTPTLADLENLTYTEMVIKETLRIYPPAWSVARTAIEDIPINNGYVIPKGMNIMISQYVIHHDERWFADPERFDPERFTPENEAKIPKYTYFPFLYGPRICIGNSFAMMEACLILASIAQRYRLQLVPGEKVEFDPKLTLNPKQGFHMRLERRKAVPAAGD